MKMRKGKEIRKSAREAYRMRAKQLLNGNDKGYYYWEGYYDALRGVLELKDDEEV